MRRCPPERIPGANRLSARASRARRGRAVEDDRRLAAAKEREMKGLERTCDVVVVRDENESGRQTRDPNETG